MVKKHASHKPEDVEARIKAALARVKDTKTILLAKVASSKPGNPPYEIRMGSNNAVWCGCNGFKYRSQCDHIERYREVMRVSEKGNGPVLAVILDTASTKEERRQRKMKMGR